MNKKELHNAMQKYADGHLIAPFEHINHTHELYGAMVMCAEKFHREILRVFSFDARNRTVKEIADLVLKDLGVYIPSRPKRFTVSYIEKVVVQFEVDAHSEDEVLDEWHVLDWENINRYNSDDEVDTNTIVVKQIG